MAPADLEAIFVQREDLAKRLVEQIRESVLTPAKHHNLLIGPRGIGKTHLVTLVVNRLTAQAGVRERMLIAWLREEEWGIMSFVDLLMRILRAISGEPGVSIPQERLDAIHDSDPNQTEKLAVRLLRDAIGEKTLLIVIENLDEIFKGLGTREQRAFRAFLQEKASVTVLATSPGLFTGASLQTSPFYGFFNVHHLTELGFEDAVLLLEKIATARGQRDLAQFLRTPSGRARVRAIDHLAHGNPRVYVILSEFLTVQSLDDLVDPVMRMLDDLTPYYQSRISLLSMQQRKIVEFLADHRSPAVVKEIARRCFMTQQTASGQLKKLTEWGYVVSERVGRQSYYELREPLMRFCLDLKKARKEPLRPLVEILRIWWTPDQLQEQLNRLVVDTTITGKYLTEALTQCQKESTDPRIAACERDYRHYVTQEKWNEALRAAEDKVAISQNDLDSGFVGLCLMHLGRHQEAVSAIGRARSAAPDAWQVQALEAVCASEIGDNEKVLRLTEKLIGTRAIRLEALRLRVKALFNLGKYDEAVKTNSSYLKLRPKDGPAWSLSATALLSMHRWQESEIAARKAVEFGPDNPAAALSLGASLLLQSKREEALTLLLRSHELGAPAGVVFFLRAQALAELQRWPDALADLGRATEDKSLSHQNQLALLTKILTTAFSNLDRQHFQSLFSETNRLLEKNAIPRFTMDQFLIRVLALASQREVRMPFKREMFEAALHDFAETKGEKSDNLIIALLYAGQNVQSSGDRTALLQLPREERELLEPLLQSLTKDDQSTKK